jgi:UDP:flavonoid glycosyltransferase YjiC (YdhE family)
MNLNAQTITVPTNRQTAEVERYSSPKRTGLKKILFVGEAVCLAHIGRPAVLARWAKEAGYETAFACGEAYADAARAEGHCPLPLPAVSVPVNRERIARGKFFYTADEIVAYVQADVEVIRSFQPDLVVSDLRLSMDVAAKTVGVPLLALVNAHWSPGGGYRLPAPGTGVFRYFPPTWRDGLFAAIMPLAMKYFPKPLDDARRRCGFKPLADMRRHYTAGDYCAYLDLPELFPIPRMPHGHFYLGPLAWTPKNLPPPPLDELSADRPLVYVSMGSTGNEKVLPTVLRATAAAGFQIVLSGLGEKETAELRRAVPELTGRFAAGKCFDPAPVLRRAALTICHGGSGTIYQSLAHGVPVISVPDNPDQGLIARQVATAGAGVWVRPEALKTTDWTETFSAAMNCAEAAAHFGRLIHAHDTRAHWLRWLTAFGGCKNRFAVEARGARSAT